MRTKTTRKWIGLTLCGLCLLDLFGLVGLRAGELASEEPASLAPPSPLPNPPLNVAESNKDESGNIKVHEQGVVRVEGTVNVGNNPAVQDVRVTNDPLRVTGDLDVGQGTVRALFEEVFPFDKDTDFTVDIRKFDKVRLSIVVNGSDSTVDVVYATDANVRGSFSVDTGDSHTVYLGEIPGTSLSIFLNDPDGEQVFVKVFGSN